MRDYPLWKNIKNYNYYPSIKENLSWNISFPLEKEKNDRDNDRYTNSISNHTTKLQTTPSQKINPPASLSNGVKNAASKATISLPHLDTKHTQNTGQLINSTAT